MATLSCGVDDMRIFTIQAVTGDDDAVVPHALAIGFGGVGVGLGSLLPRPRRVRAEVSTHPCASVTATGAWFSEAIISKPGRAWRRDASDATRGVGCGQALVSARVRAPVVSETCSDLVSSVCGVLE